MSNDSQKISTHDIINTKIIPSLKRKLTKREINQLENCLTGKSEGFNSTKMVYHFPDYNPPIIHKL